MVRGFYEAVNAWLETYWADPSRPLADTPGVDEVFERMDPAAEWDWLLAMGREGPAPNRSPAPLSEG